MANHEQHDGTPPGTSGEATPPLTSAGAARRRMAGLGASGVLMTLASNNAMAALVCKSPSGALSGNLSSQQPGGDVNCQGRSPGYWKNHPASWPADVAASDPFPKFFPCQGDLAQVTCLEILRKQSADRHNVGMHLMATYLNVATGRIGFLSRDTVVGMWTEFQSTQHYVPAEGATPWSGSQLVDYLASTMS